MTLDLLRDDNNKVLDISNKPVSFCNNVDLLPANTKLPLTKDHINEIYKCSKSIKYFAENYLKILSLDEGYILPKIRDYQETIMNNYINNRFNQIMASRRTGKSSTITMCLVWDAIFNPNTIIGLTANKWDMVEENMLRFQEYYKSLPVWLKPGIIEWQKTSIKLDNGSKVYTATSTGDAFRGLGIKVLFIDECAFIGHYNEFANSVLPTVTSSKTSKIISTSTPKGLNHWYDLWMAAENGTSIFKNLLIKWDQVPGQDEKWKENIIKMLPGGARAFAQEYDCEFLGSSDTLVDIDILISLSHGVLESDKGYYFKPKEGHNYILVGDAAKGGNDDFSIHIIDVTKLPFKQVYSNNFNCNYLELPIIINNLAIEYNNALIIIENNEGAGTSVCDILYQVYEYENIYKERGKNYFGVRTTLGNRSRNLSNLKWTLENSKLIIYDKTTLEQLFSFININGKYQADRNKKDDSVMALSLLFNIFNNIKDIENYNSFISQMTNKAMEFEEEDNEILLLLNNSWFDN